MGGGRIQLVIKGEQDLYLTGNPEISFFKNVYRKHTNFSMELIDQDISSNISTNEFIGSFMIKKSIGDLLYKSHLEIDLPSIELFNKTATYGSNDNKGFPDNSRKIPFSNTSKKIDISENNNSGFDRVFKDCLPITGKTDILYSYGTPNQSFLKDNSYNIESNNHHENTYKNPYLKNSDMYDYNSERYKRLCFTARRNKSYITYYV